MWVFLKNAFLSVVAHEDPEKASHVLCVRARLPGDIKRVFPQAEVIETPGADYRYRAFLPKGDVIVAMARAANAIDYPNFKNEVNDPDRYSAYLSVWNAMYSAQLRAHPDAQPELDPRYLEEGGPGFAHCDSCGYPRIFCECLPECVCGEQAVAVDDGCDCLPAEVGQRAHRRRLAGE